MSDDWQVVEEAAGGWPTPNKYTDAIARLREREAQLEEALREIADVPATSARMAVEACRRIARRALVYEEEK